MVELKMKKESLNINLYVCTVKLKNKYFKHLITVDHIPQEIFRFVHFFIKTESGSVLGYTELLVYQASMIPAGEISF